MHFHPPKKGDTCILGVRILSLASHCHRKTAEVCLFYEETSVFEAQRIKRAMPILFIKIKQRFQS